MRYIRGSHLKGVRPHRQSGTLGFSQSISDFGTEHDRDSEVAFTARAGDLIAHHALTIHRADANCAPSQPCRAVGLIYYGASAQHDTDEAAFYRSKLITDLKEQGRIETEGNVSNDDVTYVEIASAE